MLSVWIVALWSFFNKSKILEDDEYQPGDEEVFSDEDVTNTTFSDIESQPSTPGSALLYNEQDFDSPTKGDSDFKVPKAKSLSAVSF